MRLIWTSVLAATALIITSASVAAAETRPEAAQSRVGIDVDFLHTSGQRLPDNMVTADLVAQIGVTRHLFIDVEMPVGLLASQIRTVGVLGNPMIGAHYAGRLHRRLSGFVGLALGIPVARGSDPHTTDEITWAATIPRAWHDPYRFIPHAVPAIARAGLELDLAPVFLRAEVSPGVLLGLRAGQGTAYLQAAVTAGLRARFGLEGGLRALGTFPFVAGDADKAQTAIEPFVGYSAPESIGVYARYGLLVAIDAPLGFGADGLRVFTHRFSVGAKF